MSATGAARGYRGGYVVGFVIIAVVAVRVVLFYQPDPRVPILLVAAFGLLYGLEPWLGGRLAQRRVLFLALQTGVLIVLSNLRPFTDFSTVLYLPLALQVVRAFPLARAGNRRRVTLWLALYAALMCATLMLGLAWAAGLAILLLELASGVFLISYDLMYTQMQADQAESQRLLADLQAANQRLQEYAGQAEALAATRERNRLARELHDSVSQAIFSIRLTTEAARILLERDPACAPEQVSRLQTLTADTLARLRSLIAELRPPRDA